MTFSPERGEGFIPDDEKGAMEPTPEESSEAEAEIEASRAEFEEDAAEKAKNVDKDRPFWQKVLKRKTSPMTIIEHTAHRVNDHIDMQMEHGKAKSANGALENIVKNPFLIARKGGTVEAQKEFEPTTFVNPWANKPKKSPRDKQPADK